jgi:hypothetical protein
MLPAEAHRRPVRQGPQNLKGFVHPASSSVRVDPADLDLVSIFASDSHAESESTRCHLGQRGELSGHRDRVAERE